MYWLLFILFSIIGFHASLLIWLMLLRLQYYLSSMPIYLAIYLGYWSHYSVIFWYLISPSLPAPFPVPRVTTLAGNMVGHSSRDLHSLSSAKTSLRRSRSLSHRGTTPEKHKLRKHALLPSESSPHQRSHTTRYHQLGIRFQALRPVNKGFGSTP